MTAPQGLYRKTETYQLRDRNDRLVAVHIRKDTPNGKRFCWRQPDGTPGLNGTRLEELPLYGSQLVDTWTNPDDPVILAEGEKAAQALIDAEFNAVGTVTGAGVVPSAEALEVLRDRDVVLWPDNDGQGREHMRRVAQRLRGIAAEVRWFTWHDAPEKGDAANHPAVLSGDDIALDRLLQDLMEAPRWTGVTASQILTSSVTAVTPIRFSEMDPPGPREYVIEGTVPKGHTTSLFGDGGSAKSILALSAATAIAGEADVWMGRKVQNCPVLYVDFELDADEQRRRAYQVARGMFLDKPPHDLLYVSGLGHPAGEVLKTCLDICAEHEVGFVIVDSLGIALQGDAESARDVIKFHHDYLDPFRAAGVTLLVVDHQSKTQARERYQNKRSFGSVYKENLSRSVIQVEPGERGEGLLFLKLRQTKHNFGPKTTPFGSRLTFSEEKVTVGEHTLDAAELAEENILNARDRVMLALKAGPSYSADIAEATGMPLGTVKNELTRLRKGGLIEYTGEVEGQARQVRLSEDELSVTGVTDHIEGCDAVTLEPADSHDHSAEELGEDIVRNRREMSHFVNDPGMDL